MWRALTLVVVALAQPSLVGAQASVAPMTAPTRGTSLRDAVAAALARNPDVLLANALVDSARAERRIAVSFPNPTLAGNPNTPYQYVASVPLDVTPRRRYRAQTAALGITAADADRRDTRRQTTLAVARAFFDALLADEKRCIAVERRRAVMQILAADSARFRAGDIPGHSLARSEVELARADADLARAGLDVANTRIGLQGIMGIAPPDTASGALGSLAYRRLDPPEDSLVAIARVHRPDLLASAQRVDQSRTGERAAAALLFPTPVFSFVRQYTAPFESGHFYSLGLAFELPSVNLYRGERERAAVGVRAAEAMERRAGMQVERDVVTALAQFRVTRSLVERYQSGVLAKVNEAVQAAQYAYDHGATSLLEVLDAVRSQQDVLTEYAVALHDYWVSVYALNAAVGTDVAGVDR